MAVKPRYYKVVNNLETEDPSEKDWHGFIITIVALNFLLLLSLGAVVKRSLISGSLEYSGIICVLLIYRWAKEVRSTMKG